MGLEREETVRGRRVRDFDEVVEPSAGSGTPATGKTTQAPTSNLATARSWLNWRAALAIGAAVAVLALLFPPYHITAGSGRAFAHAFGTLFEPPSSRHTINLGLLMVEFVVIAVASGVAAFLLRK